MKHERAHSRTQAEHAPVRAALGPVGRPGLSIWLVVGLLCALGFLRAGTSAYAQTTGVDDVRVHRAPYLLETGAGRPIRAEWITLTMPESWADGEATSGSTVSGIDDAPSNTVMTPLLRFPSEATQPGPPVFIVSANLFAPNRPLPEVDRVLEFVSLFNDNADVLIVGLRGFAQAQPALRCAASYDATLDAVGDRTRLVSDLGAYFSTCDEFWKDGGVVPTAFNAANMAADLDAARRALGYGTMKLVGIDFGSQIALESVRRFPTHIDRMLLILPIGPDQLLKSPANVQRQLEMLAQRVQQEPQLATRIPDFLGLVGTVLARLETQPVTVSVRDPDSGVNVDIKVGQYDLQVATARALTSSEQWALPARYYEMNQGDFTWLGQQAYALRTDITANLTNLTALCASGASQTRRDLVAVEAASTLLGDAINGVAFDLCTAVGDPDLGEAFRSDVVTDVPTLFVAGNMDAFAPPENVTAMLPGFTNGQTLIVDGGSHDLLAESLPLIAPTLRDFMTAPVPQATVPTPSATAPSVVPANRVTLPTSFAPVRIEPVTSLVWTGQYFNNRNLQGDPTIVREDAVIDFDWGEGSPSPDIGVDNFSVRWTTAVDLPAGTYRVSLWVDDGVRLWVDDVLVVDQWTEGTARNIIHDINLVRGRHYVRMEYFEAEDLALARMSVSRVEEYPDWRADYFDNVELAGDPVVIRNERTINANWGIGAPVIGVPADNFSVRWTRQLTLSPGTYTLALSVTGGARLWLNGQILIDDWQAAPARMLTAQTPPLPLGTYDFRVEYFKTVGDGAIQLRWTRAVLPAVPPQAVISAPVYAQVGQSITLDGSGSLPGSGGDLTSFAWDLGDGNASAGTIVQYGYTVPGIYNVSLTVTDVAGQIDTSTVQIRVGDAPVITPAPDTPPVPVIVAPLQGTVGSPVRFDASRSQSTNPVVSFAWQFGDGTTANAVLVDKTYGMPGVYNVVLTLEDSAGLTQRANRLISIFAPTPAPTPSLPPTVVPPVSTPMPSPTMPLVPTATVPSDVAPLTPQPTLDPNVTLPPQPTVDPNATFTPQPTVDPNATLTPQSTPDPNATLVPQPESPLTVVISPPQAAIKAIVDGQRLVENFEDGVPVVTVAPGQTVVFDGSDSTPGTNQLTSFFWDTGDGNTLTGPSVLPGHQYAEMGRYTVSVTVLDAAGLSSSAQMIVDVRPAE